MRKLVLVICSVIYGLPAVAQSKGHLSVRIINDQQAPLENAIVELLTKDSSLVVKTAITDKSGVAEIDNIIFGSYLVKVSLVNHAVHYSTVFIVSAEQASIKLADIVLSTTSTAMSGVTVTARKPFIQKLTDRIVVNVENSIVNAGSSAMDVLERSPGINIDQNDVISLRGRNGVIIMIDGKLTAMSGADLANYLRGLPSAAIERIDIITNPAGSPPENNSI